VVVKKFPVPSRLKDIFAIMLPAFSLLQVLSFPAFSYFYLDAKEETHNKNPPLAIYEKNLPLYPCAACNVIKNTMPISFDGVHF
jgi:hypothetical protein